VAAIAIHQNNAVQPREFLPQLVGGDHTTDSATQDHDRSALAHIDSCSSVNMRCCCARPVIPGRASGLGAWTPCHQ
jgi:hypothetical protein